MALLRPWKRPGTERVIVFTLYDLPAREPQHMTRSRSLMGRIIQKRTRPQNEPVPFESLASDERALVLKWFPELKT